jgi:hypothetical protein
MKLRACALKDRLFCCAVTASDARIDLRHLIGNQVRLFPGAGGEYLDQPAATFAATTAASSTMGTYPAHGRRTLGRWGTLRAAAAIGSVSRERTMSRRICCYTTVKGGESLELAPSL